MPYSNLSELPDGVKPLPTHAKEIYMAAFNAAFKQYDGDEAKSHATAWAAVKRKYEKNADGKWVAKTEEAIGGELSDENKRELLQTALTNEYMLGDETPTPSGVYVEDVFDDHLIYCVNGQLYKANYVLGADGVATFGDPEKVVAQKVYQPMESLQSTYSDIIQEVGRRNASLDASRIKKILAICQELLSSEVEPEEKKAKEALKEANSALEWLKEQVAMKTEDGVKYPAEAFAYVPDAENPETWDLRLWETLDKKITKNQLRLVAASLSKGGRDGKKAMIPVAALAEVKRRVRAEYRSLGVDVNDIPKWVKEVLTRELVQNFVPLTEAKFDKGRATVIVIKPGFNTSEDRYYPADMLKRDYKIFEGMKMYADHPTEDEDKNLPERSIKDTGWVAVLKDVSCDEAGVVTGVAEIIEPWLMTKLATLRDKKLLSEMGISINAVGKASKATIDGKETMVIEELTAARSVDFVTEPGAGGIVTFYESDRSRDIDLVELSGLRERRPDLVSAIEADVREVIQQEVKKAMENEEKITELEGQITTLTKERDDLKEAALKAEKDKLVAEAQATIKEAVDKAELPEAAKEVLIKRFATAESADGIDEAIQAEVDYIAKLTEAGKVKGLGATKSDPAKDKEALKESFRKMHPEWTDEQIETAVTGR